MITTSDKTLSATITAVLEEVNRGIWKADRDLNIPVLLPTGIQITADVMITDGEVRVRSINVTDAGEGIRTTEETQSSKQDGDTQTAQGGKNVSVRITDYEEKT